MMLAPHGNMSDVYAEFWRMQEIADEAERYINEVASSALPAQAEISEGEGDWYLVNCSDVNRAMRWLPRRRFGVFRPERQKVVGNLKYPTMEAVLPGKLLVYVWDIDRMRDRLLATPGVSSLLCQDGKPYRINRRDKEGVLFVDRLRSLSFQFQTPNSRADREANRHIERQQKRRRPRTSRKIKRADKCHPFNPAMGDL